MGVPPAKSVRDVSSKAQHIIPASHLRLLETPGFMKKERKVLLKEYIWHRRVK